MLINNNYRVLNKDNKFVDFSGIQKSTKDLMYNIELENGLSIKCSENHIFIVGNEDISVKELSENISYLSTISGDSIVTKIEKIEAENIELYDIVNADEGYSYITNGIISHNCSFLGSGDNFIPEEALKRIEENEIEIPLRQEYIDNEMYIFEDPEPDETYIQTIDVSAGHGDDYSTINIFKVIEFMTIKKVVKNGKTLEKKIRRNKLIQVAEYYNKIRPEELANIAYDYGRRYNNAYSVIDVTNGYGVITIDKLLENGYDNIHYSEISHKPVRDRLNGYIKTSQKVLSDGKITKIDLVPGFMIGSNRGSVLIELQRSINMEDVVIKSARLLGELKTFVTVAGNRVADHKRSFHDDSIMGTSMALYCVFHSLFNLEESKEKTKKMLDSIMKVNGNNYDNNDEKDNVNNNNNTNYNESKNREISNRARNSPYYQHNWLFAGLNRK